LGLYKKFLRQSFAGNLTPVLGIKIKKFWKDESVLEVYTRRNEFHILDNTGYYIEHIKRISTEGYVPNELDILQTRIVTTGINETSFVEKERKYIIIDVGGQRSERRKWLHVFEEVTVVIFCVGLSSFDETIREESLTNGMLETLNVFNEIYTSHWLQSSVMILFLNKSDLFKEQLASGKSISNLFPEFTGGVDYNESISFITAKFTKVATDKPIVSEHGGTKTIYCHVTNATDTENIRFVFNSLKDSIVKDNFNKAGFF